MTDETRVFLEVFITSDVKLTQHTEDCKYGGCSVMVWGCFAALQPWQLALIDRTTNYVIYEKMQMETFPPSGDLKFKHNDPKYTNKSTSK